MYEEEAEALPQPVGRARVRSVWGRVKQVFWSLFLLVAPALCLRYDMLVVTVLVGLYALLLDFKEIDPLIAWARGWTPVIRGALMLYHLGAAGLAGYLLLQPVDPRWTVLPGTDALNNAAVAEAPAGLLVLGHGDLWLHARGEPPRSLAYPGPLAWVSRATSDGSLWVVPRDEPQIFRLQGERWHVFPRPAGLVQGAAGRSTLWLVLARTVFSLDPGAVRWDRWEQCPGATGVAVAPDDEQSLLVVGEHWCASVDGGRSWTEATPPVEEFGHFPEAARGGGGWQYVYSSHPLVSCSLHARGPGEAEFTARGCPASDVRALAADPRDGRRVWAGTWGEGVFASEDGGISWSEFGLERIQVGSMVIDPVARTLAVASNNTVFNKGVYVRAIDG